jgi:hypothetical protein
MKLKIIGDDIGLDLVAFEKIVEEYEGKNEFLIDVISKVKRKAVASAKQVSAVLKVHNAEKNFAEKNKERLERLVPMKEGRGEVIGEVISLKEVDGRFGFQYKMLVEDFKGYRVYGTVPKFLVDAEVEKGDFVKFTATLKEKETGFGFYSRPNNGVLVDKETAEVTKEEIEKLKPKKKTPEELVKVSIEKKKAETTRELMDFLSA